MNSASSMTLLSVSKLPFVKDDNLGEVSSHQSDVCLHRCSRFIYISVHVLNFQIVTNPRPGEKLCEFIVLCKEPFHVFRNSRG